MKMRARIEAHAGCARDDRRGTDLDVLETIAVERIEYRLDELEGASRHSTTHDQAHLRPH
jgi:hypothetical protein